LKLPSFCARLGNDVYTVHDQGLVGAEDQVLAHVCQDEHRAFVTLDTYFADIRTYPPGDFSGIIVLRLTRQDKLHVLRVMSRVIKLTTPEALDHKLWIVDEDKVRMRA